MSTVSVTNVVSTTVQATEIKSNSATAPVMIENNAGVEVGWFARTWVSFTASGNATQTIRGSGNTTSVTRISAGTYRYNFATAMPDANYTALPSCGADATGNTLINTLNFTTTSVDVVAYRVVNSPALTDTAGIISISIVR